MKIEDTKQGSVTVVKIMESRLGAERASEFKEHMSALIDQGQRRLVLNLSEVSFIDSIGLGAIVSTLKLLDGDGDIVILGARDTVRSVLKLTRMDKVFRIFENVQEAVAAIGRGGSPSS